MSFIHNLTDVRIVPQKLGILQCVQTMLNIMRGRYCTQIPIDILFQISQRFRGPCGLSGNTGYKWQYYFFIEVLPVCSAVCVVGGNALSETLHFKFFQCQFSPSSGSVTTASRLFLLSMRFAGFWLVGRRWRHWDSRQIPPGILVTIQNFQTNGLFEIHFNCFKSMEIPGVEIQAGLGVLANVGSAGRGRLVDAIWRKMVVEFVGVFCRGIDSNLDAVVTSATGAWGRCSVIRFSPGQHERVSELRYL